MVGFGYWHPLTEILWTVEVLENVSDLQYCRSKNLLNGTQLNPSTQLGIQRDTEGATLLIHQPYPMPAFPPEQVCDIFHFHFLSMHKPQTICELYYTCKKLLKNLPVSYLI